jgi:pimeloyl-ACP methyl ester carboxylesterase
MATATRDIFVEANGLRHHLLARGTPGRSIVMLIHGLTQQAHVFDGIAERLAERFHVYSLDVRGRGESEWGKPDEYDTDHYVADLEAVRAALGIERFSLVGTSMGGLISMHYAPRYPERVDRVVINDIGPELNPAGLKRIFTVLTSAPQAFQDLKAVLKYYREENAVILAGRDDEEAMDYARWHVRKDEFGLYVWKLDPAIRTAPPPPPTAIAPWPAFEAIARPVLVVRGAQSDLLTPETAAAMVARGKACRAIEVPGVGHAPTLVEPAAAEAVISFLSER